MNIEADLTAIYTDIGEPATHNGAPCTICCFAEHGLHDSGEYIRRQAECRVRASEVARPVLGADIVEYQGREWVVVDLVRSDAWEHVLMLADDPAMQMG
jgi:hypothetical protein